MIGFPFYIAELERSAVCYDINEKEVTYIYRDAETNLIYKDTCPIHDFQCETPLNHIFLDIEVYANIIEVDKSNDTFGYKAKRNEFISAELKITNFVIPDEDDCTKEPYLHLETGRLVKTKLRMLVSEVYFSFPTISRRKVNKKSKNV